jgi:hypothetical protein
MALPNRLNACFAHCLLALLLLPLQGGAQKPVQSAPPAVEKITETTYRVGAALVDTRSRTVTCPGVVNMDAGTVEYLAVAPHGKLHESVLRLDVRPIHLQVALLLLGIEPKNVLKYQGDPHAPEGAPLEIRVKWRDAAGTDQEAAASDLLGVLRTGSGPCSWVFTGSRILRAGFEGDISQSLIAVWHDPAALIDNRAEAGAWNAYIVRKGHVPKRGTPIQLVIHPAEGGRGTQ